VEDAVKDAASGKEWLSFQPDHNDNPTYPRRDSIPLSFGLHCHPELL